MNEAVVIEDIDAESVEVEEADSAYTLDYTPFWWWFDDEDKGRDDSCILSSLRTLHPRIKAIGDILDCAHEELMPDTVKTLGRMVSEIANELEVFLETMSERRKARQALVEAEKQKKLDESIEKVRLKYEEMDRRRIEEAAEKLLEARLKEQHQQGKKKSQAKKA